MWGTAVVSNPEVLIRLKTPTGEVYDVPALVARTDGDYRLEMTIPRLGFRRAVGPDQFECLLRLRAELEPLGYRTLVNGARRNAWPSGMGRDMGGGRLAYLLVLGQHDQKPALVDIFEAADEADLSVVEDQRAFFDSWIAEVES